LSGWIVEKINNKTFVFTKKFPFLPALIMKIYYPEKPVAFKEVEILRKKHKPILTQIFPKKESFSFEKHKFKKAKNSGHLTKTVQIGLAKPQKDIFNSFKKDCRYSIKKAKSLEIKTSKDIRIFQKAFRKTSGLNHYAPSILVLKKLKKAFGKNCLFLEARKDNKIIAGTVTLFSEKSAYYYYAFTNKAGRKTLAQYALVWEAIKMARKRKCSNFDMQGIYDKRFPQKPWLGFTHFKKSFSGKEIKFPPAYQKTLFNQ
ncbi:peptidoglycan bridge formation glycyltransferase FemA/FemB family protein, partial [Patescibacteria group bacterium]|nr:peptidoglycan bridge formation glycyltransferase FemA/FemB family protein [Patescibacteria group bacterium]